MGGTDLPIEGELGVGGAETVISRLRRLAADELVINDNDNPAALNIGTYFNQDAGSDTSIYFQTLDDGVASLVTIDNITTVGGNFVRFNLPQAVQDILNAIDVGTRFIFVVARPGTTTTPDPLQLSAAFESGTSSLVADLSLSSLVTPLQLSAAFEGGTSSLVANLTLSTLEPPLQLSVAFESRHVFPYREPNFRLSSFSASIVPLRSKVARLLLLQTFL